MHGERPAREQRQRNSVLAPGGRVRTPSCTTTRRRGPVLACIQAAAVYMLLYVAVALELHLFHLSVASLLAGSVMSAVVAFAVNTLPDGRRGVGSCTSVLAGVAGVVVGGVA